MAVAYIAGFETGDASEVSSLGTGASIQSVTVRTGGYALKQAATNTNLKNGMMSTTQSIIRVYAYFPATPAASTGVIQEVSVAPLGRIILIYTSTGKLRVQDNSAGMGLTTTTGATTVSAAVWHLIEMAIDLAAGGVVKVWLDGVLEINVTHTTDVSASVTDRYILIGAAATNEFFFDDIRVDSGSLAQIGHGRCIARQGLAGTPAYDAWTKNGAATAALCWSDTPFNTATNCSDTVLNDAQTMLVEKFSVIQSGHGSEVIGGSETVNACKVAMIAKTAIAGNSDMRRRVDGVDTDTTKALTTSDAYYDSGIFTDTAAKIDAYEIGVQSLLATLTTVEDMWMMVDYVPAAIVPIVARQYRERRS